jgi:hypothetical protein
MARKKPIGQELKGARWQLTPEDLAKALSRKTLKSTSQPLRPDEIDDISRYDLDIDLIPDHLLSDAANSLRSFTPSRSKEKRIHCKALGNYINDCLNHCRSSFPLVARPDSYHSTLQFETYNRQIKDGIIDVHLLKPGLVGVHAPLSKEDRVSWLPKVSEHNQALFIPVEVRGNFNGILAQASTYARGLFSVSPLRQFSLVLGYNQRTHELRFLVYHSGGVSMNEPLFLNNHSHKKEILRLFLSILTWKTDGDAGLPEWLGGTMMEVPGYVNDEQGLLVQLTKILSNNFYIRGGSQIVYRCRTVKGQRRRRLGLRRSKRIAEKAATLPSSK